MVKHRAVSGVIEPTTVIEGAGVRLLRSFGPSRANLFDPFLLFDHFAFNDPREGPIRGFPTHPHRGIETVTYILGGVVEHGDSLGNSGVIGTGDVQWMTAGSGIIHQEMPKGDDNGVMEGFQLWANLPKSRKMMDPRYRDIKSSQVPEVVTKGGARVKVICGTVDGKKGPVTDIVIDPEYLDVTLPARSEFVHKTTRGHTVFAYVIEGKGVFCNEKNPFAYDALGENYFDMERDAYIHNGTAVLFGDGDQVTVSTQGEAVRFLLVSGKPIGEPVAWYGPIVMNTEEELQTAFDEYRDGTFIKHGGGRS